MSTLQTSCPSFSDLAEYWTTDIAPADIERIERTKKRQTKRPPRRLARKDDYW